MSLEVVDLGSLGKGYEYTQFDIEANGETLHVTAGNKSRKKPGKTKKEESKNQESEKEENKFEQEIKKNTEENEVSDNISFPSPGKWKSIGIVVYGSNQLYTNNKEADKDVHIPHATSPSPLALWLKKILEKLYKNEILEIVMGHEHGKDNQKCHLQIIVTFKKECRRILTPGFLKIKNNIETIDLLYMQQKAKNQYALKTYCKKDGDITIVKGNNYKKKEKKVDDETENVFRQIIESKDTITQKEALELIQQNNPKDYFKSFNNLSNAIKSLITDKPTIEFKWMPIPEYLKNYFLSDGTSFFDTFNAWYQKYCINGENLERKKALCLYSAERAMGKSYFVRHLVSDPGYILEYNNTFCPKNNINSPIYKLLLLDDMQDITPETATMWKSLIASEPTTIRGAWVNEAFSSRLPCIITTNNLRFVATLYGDKAYNTQTVIIEIKEYMGAPGTKREDLFQYEFIISDQLAKKIQKLNNNNI